MPPGNIRLRLHKQLQQIDLLTSYHDLFSFNRVGYLFWSLSVRINKFAFMVSPVLLKTKFPPGSAIKFS